MSKQELDDLRSEIDKIDRELVHLLSKRRDIAREIGLTKRKDGVKLRDTARERKVVDKMAALAGSLGGDKKLAKEAAKLLIADAVTVQKEKSALPLEGKKALVVGGSGSMGGWTCRFLSNRGAKVKVWDPRGRRSGYSNVKTLSAAVSGSDIIVIASPLGLASQELKMVLDENPNGLIMDVCSVKSHISGQLRMAAAGGLQVASVHPMFGPKAASPKGLNVVICDCGCREATAHAKELFADAGANVAELYLEEHDRMMSYILGLSHLTALMFGTTLISSGKRTSELRDIQGTSFTRLASIAKEVSAESRRVYHDIQSLNPHTREMVEAAERSLQELKDAALDTDHDKFISSMESARRQMET